MLESQIPSTHYFADCFHELTASDYNTHRWEAANQLPSPPEDGAPRAAQASEGNDAGLSNSMVMLADEDLQVGSEGCYGDHPVVLIPTRASPSLISDTGLDAVQSPVAAGDGQAQQRSANRPSPPPHRPTLRQTSFPKESANAVSDFGAAITVEEPDSDRGIPVLRRLSGMESDHNEDVAAIVDCSAIQHRVQEAKRRAANAKSKRDKMKMAVREIVGQVLLILDDDTLGDQDALDILASAELLEMTAWTRLAARLSASPPEQHAASRLRRRSEAIDLTNAIVAADRSDIDESTVRAKRRMTVADSHDVQQAQCGSDGASKPQPHCRPRRQKRRELAAGLRINDDNPYSTKHHPADEALGKRTR